MSHFLMTIDTDYRNSLYNHYMHHMELQPKYLSAYMINGYKLPGYEYLLPRSKFSFRNIHINIGSVKW